MKITPFTMHVRLTKACNANCTYCSSYMENPDKFMSLDSYKKSLDFIWNKLVELNIHITHLNLEYVGGEILLLPIEVLRSQVEYAREFFAKKSVVLIDGAQTNLIGSNRKVNELNHIFNNRIGTSIDSFTDQRRVGDSAKKYRVIMMSSENSIQEKTNKKLPAVFTIDRKSIGFTNQEIKLASRNKRNLTIRPVFSGGSEIEGITPTELAEIMETSFDNWFMKMPMILEPHFSLLQKRIQSKQNIDPRFERSYCSFQSDCAKKSISLEPNGDLYICQELADASNGVLGNSLAGTWDQETWLAFSERENNISSDCLSCDYFKECQGGCMMQAIEEGKGIYGKPGYCEAWKAIFTKIDYAIENTDINHTMRWINKLNLS